MPRPRSSPRGWLAEQPNSLQLGIVAEAHLRHVQAGGAVYHQGDAPDGLYGLVSGSVKFTSSTVEGREVIAGILSTGGWFGELGLFDGLPRVHSAFVLRDAWLLCLPARAFV